VHQPAALELRGGETDVHTLYATFAPNATYTGHSDRNEATVYTFRASSDVVGTESPATTTTTGSSSSTAKATSQDIVGSALFEDAAPAAVAAARSTTITTSRVTPAN